MQPRHDVSTNCISLTSGVYAALDLRGMAYPLLFYFIPSGNQVNMAQHDDLMEAALNAVNAIEARPSGNRESDKTPEPSRPDSGKESNALSDDIASLMGDDEEFSIDLSLSSLDAMESSDSNKLTSDIKLQTLETDNKSSDESRDTLSGDEESGDLAQKVSELTAALAEARQKSDDLQKEIDQMYAVQKQFNDKLIRVSADFDNYRKRVARDQELMRNQAEERIVTGFLPVMDNLERALVHARQQNDYEQLVQGVEMTSKLYLAALAKHGCVPFGSLGETFDPVYHDVLQRVIDPEKPHNLIVQEHLKGYMMHDHVLRPALVVVSQHEGEES